MVKHAGKRCADNAIAGPADAKAKFDVAAAEVERLVEAADAIKEIAPDHQASAGDGRKVAIPMGRPHKRPFIGVGPGEEMVGEAVHPNHIAAVLNASVLPPQLRTNNACLLYTSDAADE